MTERVVVLTEDKIKALLANCTHAYSGSALNAAGVEDAFEPALDDLRKALEQPQEFDYQVVGDGRLHTETAACRGLDHARGRAKELAVGSALVRAWKNIRIQRRIKYTGPWTDLDQEGEG